MTKWKVRMGGGVDEEEEEKNDERVVQRRRAAATAPRQADMAALPQSFVPPQQCGRKLKKEDNGLLITKA